MNQQIKIMSSVFINFDFDFDPFLPFYKRIFCDTYKCGNEVWIHEGKKTVHVSQKIKNMKINRNVDELVMITKEITDFNVIFFQYNNDV